MINLKDTKPGGWVMISIILAIFAFSGKWAYDKWMPKTVKESAVIAINDLPPLAYDSKASAPARALPDTNTAAEATAPEWRAELMGWNAQAGIAYANGGPQTMAGSLMAEYGINLKIACQNMCDIQGQDVFAFAQEYAKGNKNSRKGCQMIAWMGDANPSYLAGLNKQIAEQIGPDYILTPFAAFGASFGEDKAIYKNASFKKDPNKLRGSLWCGVIRDGDWNIMMEYCQLNQIPVNNDLTTFDPNAVNWMAAPKNDYTEAAQAYVHKVKETRKIVRDGKLTDKDTTVEVSGVVTWFPGDRVAFEGRGGVTVIEERM